MTGATRVVLVALVVLGAAMADSTARAQARGGSDRRDGIGSDPFWLLQIEQVQKELKLADDQKATVREIGEKIRDEWRKHLEAVRELPREQQREKMPELLRKTQARTKEIRKQIEKVPLPDQLARLKQIHLQVQGTRALANPEVQTALNVTEKQKQTFEGIREHLDRQLGELRSEIRREMRNLSREELRKKMTEVRKQTRELSEQAREKMLDLLTPEQNKKLEEMKGEKFELDRERLFRSQKRPEHPAD